MTEHLKRPLKWVPCAAGCVNRTLVLATHDATKDGPAYCSPKCEKQVKDAEEFVAKGKALNHPASCRCFGSGIIRAERWGNIDNLCDQGFRYLLLVPGGPAVTIDVPFAAPAQQVMVEVKEMPALWGGVHVAPDGTTTEWSADERQDIQLPAGARRWNVVTWCAVLTPAAILLGWALLMALSAAGYG